MRKNSNIKTETESPENEIKCLEAEIKEIRSREDSASATGGVFLISALLSLASFAVYSVYENVYAFYGFIIFAVVSAVAVISYCFKRISGNTARRHFCISLFAFLLNAASVLFFAVRIYINNVDIAGSIALGDFKAIADAFICRRTLPFYFFNNAWTDIVSRFWFISSAVFCPMIVCFFIASCVKVIKSYSIKNDAELMIFERQTAIEEAKRKLSGEYTDEQSEDEYVPPDTSADNMI